MCCGLNVLCGGGLLRVYRTVVSSGGRVVIPGPVREGLGLVPVLWVWVEGVVLEPCWWVFKGGFVEASSGACWEGAEGG